MPQGFLNKNLSDASLSKLLLGDFMLSVSMVPYKSKVRQNFQVLFLKLVAAMKSSLEKELNEPHNRLLKAALYMRRCN